MNRLVATVAAMTAPLGVLAGVLMAGVLMAGAYVQEQPVHATAAPMAAHAEWTPAAAARWPSCVAEPKWRDGRPAAAVIAQDYQRPTGDLRTMPFDHMWAFNHNRSHRDDVWVVAVCKETS